MIYSQMVENKGDTEENNAFVPYSLDASAFLRFLRRSAPISTFDKKMSSMENQ
jgi:hypothetical protein